MRINSMCMNAKRKRRRMLLWQSNNWDSQDMMCILHVSMEPEDAEWAWCTWRHLGLRHKSSDTTYMQNMQHVVIPPPVPPVSCIKQLLFVLHASEGPIALSCCRMRAWAAQTKPVRQPPPAHTTVTLRGGSSIQSALRAGKFPGKRIFPTVKSSASPED